MPTLLVEEGPAVPISSPVMTADEWEYGDCWVAMYDVQSPHSEYPNLGMLVDPWKL